MPSKDGYFYKNTVEITFNGEKVRVSKGVADSLKKSGTTSTAKEVQKPVKKTKK